MEKTTPVLTIRPNIAVAIVLQILKFASIVVIAIILLGYVNAIAGFNAFQFVYDMFKQTITIFTEATNVLSINSVEFFFLWMEEFVASHIVQALAFTLLILLSFISKSWTFYPSYFEYNLGNVLINKRGLPIGAIKSLSYMKYFKMFNVGMLSMVVHEEDIKTITIGFVNKITEKHDMIKSIIEANRVKEAAAQKNLENFK